MVLQASLVLGIMALALSVGVAGTYAVNLPAHANGLAHGKALGVGHDGDLPMQACNNGTAHARSVIPPTLPNGNVTPALFHVPLLVGGNCTRMGT